MNTIKGTDYRTPHIDEIERRRAIGREIAAEYNVSDYDSDSGVISYRLKANPKLGFSQRDVVINIHSDDVHIVRGAAMLADANGWKSVDLNGSDKFYEAAADHLEWVASVSVDRVGNSDKARADRAEVERNRAAQKVAFAKEPDISNAPKSAPKKLVFKDLSSDQEVKVARAQATTPTPENQIEAVSTREIEKVRDSEKAKISALQAATLEKINSQYRANGKKFYFKDQAGAVNLLAFTVGDRTISTSLNSERVSTSIVDMAVAKGWTALHITRMSHKEFKRQVWREATARGIEVSGYEPTKEDLAAIKMQENRVEKKDSFELRNEPIMPNQPAELARRAEEVRASREAPASGPVLKSYGPAKYQFKDNASKSYQVTVEIDGKPKTYWGLDLKRAVEKDGAEIGDIVTVTNLGRKPVTVKVPEKDETGAVIGSHSISTHKNLWSVEPRERMLEKERSEREKSALEIGNEAIGSTVQGQENQNQVREMWKNTVQTNRNNLPSIDRQRQELERQPERQNEKTEEMEL